MKNFKQLGKMDVSHIKMELATTQLWNWMALRKKAYNSGHGDVDDIVLRFQSIEKQKPPVDFMNDMECVDYFVQDMLPNTMESIKNMIMHRPTGRIVIASLKPNGRIAEHIDEGNYTLQHNRYHLVVQTNPSVKFKCEDEEVNMPEGTIWWFDNKKVHSVENHGNIPRIHIVIDIKKGE